ncbi:MAG TPA: thiol reductase thioredoxin [Flavobacteriales bacterium]|jgi:thiol-disulfide isomerase/thioredoxin|nr:thiol reductase thioredoxin [Flavobacteriales bacterium]
MTELKDDILKEIIDNNDKVVVQFGATWCGVCRLMKPKFKRMSAEHEGIEFYYVDAEKLPESRKLAPVENLPTFAGFSNGQLVKTRFGSKADVIQDVINEVASN